MSETRVATREATMRRYHIGRPILVLGILCGVAAAALYEGVALGALRNSAVMSEETAFTAAGVLALLTAPVLLYGLAWKVRIFRASLTFSTLGLFLCMIGAALFATMYPEGSHVASLSRSDATVLLVNAYGLGLLCLVMGLIVGHGLRTKHLNHLAAAMHTSTTPAWSPVRRDDVPFIPHRFGATPGASPPTHAKAAARRSFSGEVHYVSEIPGVDEDYARQLRTAGITNTAQLLARPSDGIADQTGIQEHMVRSWRGIADLLRVRGLRPDTAAVLYRSGIHDVDALAFASSKALVRATRKVMPAERNHRVDQRMVNAWIKEARAMRTVRPMERTRRVRRRVRRSRRSSTKSKSHVARR